ncbi:MAG: AraC family transcriptional regulator [Clostridiales bacterium]|nr:AraC family transcriptional regulator [Clostridiales bacterium]
MGKSNPYVIEYRVYDLPLDFPVVLLHGENWCLSDVKSNRLHFHNCYEIGFCHSEGGTLVFPDQKYEFQAGDITCIPRHIPHTTYSHKGKRSRWSYLFVDFQQIVPPVGANQSFIDDQNAAITERCWIFNQQQNPYVHFLATKLFDEMKKEKANYTWIVQHMLALMYYELIRFDSNPLERGKIKKQAFILKPALEEITQNYKNPITVGELAKKCNVSVAHFRRLFVTVVGQAPIVFLNTTRINQACTLLKTTENSVMSIAQAVGFTTISSFNRYFHQVMGTSPRKYRNRKNAAVKEKQYQRKQIIQYKGWLEPELHPNQFVKEEKKELKKTSL